jgi:hypothetical protein
VSPTDAALATPRVGNVVDVVSGASVAGFDDAGGSPEPELPSSAQAGSQAASPTTASARADLVVE